jgi:GLPGLI family protein
MIRLNLITIFIFCSIQLFAQKSVGKITYKIANIDFVDKGGNADATAMLSMAKKQQYQLLFNNKQTSFTLLELMPDESFSEFHNTLAKIYISNSDFYFDYKNNDLLEGRKDGTIVEQKIQKLPWEITSETKIIDQYQCYKATYTFEYLARDYKMKTRVITDWFAPSLPYPYGPKNYQGLPGLILELTDRTVTFLASKIELSDKELEIKLPTGKRIDKVSFDKMINNQ